MFTDISSQAWEKAQGSFLEDLRGRWWRYSPQINLFILSSVVQWMRKHMYYRKPRKGLKKEKKKKLKTDSAALLQICSENHNTGSFKNVS